MNVSAGAVRPQLETVLRSPVFANAPRLSGFLRHVVEKTLVGDGAPLKEYSIGVEVFDRGDSFDPRTDTIVRVQARRLRAKLAEYYAGEGRADSIVIELPKGGYVPRFHSSPQPIVEIGPAAQLSPQVSHPEGDTPAKPVLVETAADRFLAEGERLQATILVSNFSGFVELVEELRPEQVELAMDGIRDRVTEIVERHGGTMHRFTEEELVALFGMGLRREDYFVQAARAAFAMHSAVREMSVPSGSENGRALSLCSGIDTGTVIIRQAKRARRAGQIVGRPVQVAASLALQAGSNEILASREITPLLAPFFKTGAGVPLRLKGNSEPVTAYRLGSELGPRSRLEARALSVHVGRDGELDQMDLCWRSAQGGEGQFVSVVGEAGLGKSRLLYEFERRLEESSITVLSGRFQPHGSNTPFLAFLDALSSLLDPADDEKTGDDGLAAAQYSVQHAAARITEIDQELEPYVPFYLNLLSIPGDAFPMPEHLAGEGLRFALLEALSAIFTLSAKRKPLVLLLEDWHWSDQASRDLLARLTELAPAHSMMLVASSRPEYAFESRAADHSAIRLKPLESDQSRRIVRSVLSARDIPEDLGKVLHDRSGGNPFFLEEICQALREGGTLETEDGNVRLSGLLEDVRLPATVQAVIRARLGRLDGDARRVLRTAAVIGPEFAESVLRHVLGGGVDLAAPLEALRAADLVRQVSVVPGAAYKRCQLSRMWSSGIGNRRTHSASCEIL